MKSEEHPYGCKLAASNNFALRRKPEADFKHVVVGKGHVRRSQNTPYMSGQTWFMVESHLDLNDHLAQKTKQEVEPEQSKLPAANSMSVSIRGFGL